MHNPHDFWIGDFVKIRSSGQVGKVEGEESGGVLKVRLENAEGYVLAHAEDLEKAEEKKAAKRIELREESANVGEALRFKPEIDLHLNKLGDFHKGTWKADELSYQKHRCRKFLNEAIRLRVQRALIIHGKGEGVLKNCVESLLHEMKEVQRMETVHNGGAVEVWFKYS